ncbi:MAG: cytochrome c biogenesis protein CcsA [Planctomycetaceae bacterium]|nr:cytochrome c biogenesis protein CcsA [Planctomycetaceae bacterium]
MADVTVFCFLASYLVTGVMEVLRLRGKSTINRVVLKGFAFAGIVAHTFYLFNRSQQTNLPPLLSSTHDWLLVLAWLAMVLYLFLTLFDSDLAIGLFLIPIVLVLIGSAYLLQQQPNQLVVSDEILVKEARQGWAMLHASLLVLGMAGGLVALVLGMMYLAQHRRLRQKQTMAEGMTLPSLGRIARLNWWSVVISVPLLTLGMAVGVGLGLSTDGETSLSFTDPVIIAYGVAWLVMIGFFIWLLTTRRSQDRQIASLSIWTFSFLIVSVVVLQIISSKLSISAHGPAQAAIPVESSVEEATP